MNQYVRSRTLAFLAIACAFSVANASLTRTVLAQSRDVTVTVVDSKNVPVAAAEVEVFEYYGTLTPTEFRSETGNEGTVSLQNVELEGHAYLVVRHANFAPVVHFLSIAGQDNVTTTIRLAPAQQTFLEVRSPDGKPLQGAEVTRLEFSSESTGAKHFANHEFFKAMMGNDGSPYQSQADGRLNLPPLPNDAVLSVTVAHPGFAVGELRDVAIGELAQSALELKPGTTVEAYLAGSAEVLQELEQSRVEVRTNNRKGDRLNHSFEVRDGKFEFTLVPGPYDSLHLSGSPGMVITPSLPSSSRLAEFANVPATGPIQKKFLVRELHTVRGRVIAPDGKPVPNLLLDVRYQNLYVDDAGKQQVVEEHPTAVDMVTTDHEGRFECRLPKGTSSISAWWDSGYFSTPDEFEFVYEDQTELPDYVVRPMPVLKGVAIDELGKPVPHAVLRLFDHTGQYVFADADGRFEVPVSVLDYDDATKSRSSFKLLSVFDLESRLCAVERFDITNDEAISDITLELKRHPVNWLMERWREHSEKESKRILAASNYFGDEVEQHKKQLEEMKANHRFAPELADGTWVKGSGPRSLGDFRGKYVLLDFWFIGCGPCEEELPNLKLVHQKFKDRHFSVIGVHSAGQDSEIVKKYMDENQMDYPMVIDRFDEPIKAAFEPLGLQGYPTYFLITPEGEIDWDASVRGNMLETVRDRILKLEEADSLGDNP